MVRVVVASAKSGGNAVKRPWLGAKLQAVTPDIADSMGLKRPTGALDRQVVARQPGGARRPEGRRRHRLGRRPGRSTIRTPSTIASPPSRSAATPSSAWCAAASEHERDGGAAARARRRRATRSSSGRARRSPAPRSPICRRRWPTNCSCRTPTRASSSSTSTTAPMPAISASSAATSSSRSTASRSPRPRDLERATERAEPRLAHRHPPRRPADFRGVRRMTPRAKASGPTLFAAAGLDKDAPRPLADRLRPQKLDEVVGQDHLLGPDGALTRMLATRSLGSLIFWGPPGTGKTTVARLLAQATDLHFEQISAIFSGVADLKKVFEEARRRRETGAGHAAVRRRDPSLQPRAAGQLPAGDGGRHHHAGRRHHREPVVRAERAAAVARARAGVQVARRRRRSRSCWRAPRRSKAAQLPLDADARAALIAHGRRRRPRLADAGRGSLARRAQARPSTPRSCRRSCSAARRSTTRAQDGHYNLISALHKSVRGSDPDAALYYLAACSTPASSRSTSRAAWCAWRSRTSASPIRRRW